MLCFCNWGCAGGVAEGSDCIDVMTWTYRSPHSSFVDGVLIRSVCIYLWIECIDAFSFIIKEYLDISVWQIRYPTQPTHIKYKSHFCYSYCSWLLIVINNLHQMLEKGLDPWVVCIHCPKCFQQYSNRERSVMLLKVTVRYIQSSVTKSFWRERKEETRLT